MIPSWQLRVRREPAVRGSAVACWAVLVALAVLVAAMPGCNKARSDQAQDVPTAKPVIVQQVQRGDLLDVLTYPVELVAYSEVRVHATVPDRILDFPWENGAQIRKGQMIALIRKEGMDRGLEQIAAQMEALDVQIQNLDQELGRSQRLKDAGVLTSNAVDTVQTQYLTMQAQRKALAASRAQLAVSAGNARVTAPISGVIADKMFEKGDMASPQVPLCRILDIDRLKVVLRLVETDVVKVRVGQQALLSVDAHPGKQFRGEVTTVLPYVDQQTRTNTVEVTVDNAQDPSSGQRALKPGMFGQARLVVDERKNVVLAPEPALLLDDTLLAKQKSGQTLRRVMVVGLDGVARARVVQLGARKGTQWEVREGLTEKDRVIVRGQHGLKEGQRVEIVPDRGDKL